MNDDDYAHHVELSRRLSEQITQLVCKFAVDNSIEDPAHARACQLHALTIALAATATALDVPANACLSALRYALIGMDGSGEVKH